MATIRGTSGADILDGSAGNDFIHGFAASDTISGWGGNDKAFGGGGADLISGGLGNDNLAGERGNDTIKGGKGRDKLYGNENDDWLIGGGGNDVLKGGGGNDILRGGFGNDTLTGGGGRDRFLIGSSQGTETITDFQDGIDKIRLVQGEKLDGISFSELDLRASGRSTRIFLDKPGNKRDGDLLAIVKNIAPNKITAADIFVPNVPPTALDDALSGNEDAVIKGNVLADNGSGTDSDPDGGSLEIAGVNGSSSAVGNVTAIASGALVTLNSDGTFTYDPNGAFDSLVSGGNANDTFKYTLSDGKGGLDTATVTLSLTGINDSPTIGTNTGTTVDEGSSGVISNTQLNEADPDDSGADLFYAITWGTSNGHVELTTNPGVSIHGFTQADIDNGLVRYVHDGSETTTDSFMFALSDGGEDGATTETGTFTFTINPVNDPPVAVDDAFATDQDNLVIADLFAANPTTADSDADNASFSVTEVNGVAANVGSLINLTSGAQLTVNSSGSFTYNPNGAFDTLPGGASDTETFTYQIGDGNGGFDTATATITINGVNNAPVAVDDVFTLREDTVIGGSVLSTNPTTADSDIDDGDMLTVTQVNGDAGDVGTLITLGSGAQLTLNANGTFAYDPNGAFDSITTSGIDTFTYQIGDGNGGFDTATATLTITPVNDSPTAVDDAFGTDQDTTLNDDLFAANPTTADSDPEGATLTVTQVNGVAGNVDSAIALASGAQLTVNNDGTFSYDPNGQFDTLAGGNTTTDSFTYQISDGNGGFDTATATVTITGLNETPVAVDDAFTTDEDTALSSDNVLSANPTTADSDIDDGDTLRVTQVNASSGNVGNLITLISGAQLTLNANGTFTYDPNGTFEDITASTTDSFTYQVGDGNMGFDTATATITITPVNDVPVNTVPGAQTTNSVTPIDFTTISISDVDAGSSSLQSVISADFGTLTVAPGSGASVSNDGSDSVTIEGTLAQINAALNGLDYDPDGTTGTATITLTTSDQGNTGSGGTQTDTDTITVTVGPPNAAPVVDLDGPGGGVDFSTSFTEDAGPVRIADTDATISDADVGDAIETLTITLTNALDGLLEGISIDGGVGALPAGISAVGSNQTMIVLTNTGAASIADFQTALRLIQYENGSDTPNTTARSITVVANDGDADSTVATSTISVTAVNDPPSITPPSYTGNANLTLTVADGPGDLLDGATDPEGTSVSVVAETVASAQGANVIIAADGSFVYEAKAGFVGTDTFVYTLQDSGSPGTGTSTTVTATVVLSDLDGAGAGDDLLWFIDEDSAKAGSGTGTQADPFKSLAAFNAATTGTGDFIFLDTDSSDNNGDGAGEYGGGITLLNDQTLIGDGTTGTTLETLTGISLGSHNSLGNDYTAFDGSGTNPVIENTSGNAITLGSGNTIRGVDAGDASGMGISGGSVGTLTISDVAINNTVGGGFEVTSGGTLNVSLDSLTSGGGDHGVSLIGSTSGTFTASGGAISGASNTAFEVIGSTANVTYDGTIAGTSGQSTVRILGNSGGTKDFNGAITANTGSQTAINLNGNTGATIRFDGGLDIDTTSGTGFLGVGGGTIHVTGTNNIDTTTGTALELNMVDIGTDDITFATVDKNGTGGAVEGIDIAAVNTGTLTVSGSTIAGTAGTEEGISIANSAATFNFGSATIDSTGGDGIFLGGTSGPVTFTTIDIDGTTGSAVELSGVTGTFTIGGGTIGATTDAGNASNAAVRIGGGTASVDIAAAITNSVGEAIEVTGRTGSTVTFSGNINHSASGAIGLDIDSNTGGTVNFTGSSKTISSGTATAVDLTNNSGTTIGFTNGGLDIDTTSGIGYNATGGGNLFVTGTGNTVTTTTGTAVNIANTFISGANGITFQSVSANGATNGIVLNNTGSGSFTVTGDGTGAVNGSGGTLQNITGDAISLTNAQNVSITQLNISGAGGAGADSHGIDISNVTNFTYQDATVTGAGNADDEHSVRIRNLLGTSLFEDVTFDDINEDAIEIQNSSGTGNITFRRLDIQDHTTALNGEHGIDILSNSSANLTVLIDDSTFDINAEGSTGVLVNSEGFSTLNVTIQNSTFNAEDAFGSGSILLNSAGTSNATFIVTGNDMNGSSFTPIDILNNDNSTSAITVSGNDIDVIGTGHNGFGIRVLQDENGSATTLINNNTIDDIQFQAILIRSRDTTDGSGVINATITNNTSTQPKQAFVGSLSVESQDSNTVNVSITGNTFPGANTFPGFDSGINLDASDTSTINVTQTSQANLSAVNNGSSAGDAGSGGTVNFNQPAPPTP